MIKVTSLFDIFEVVTYSWILRCAKLQPYSLQRDSDPLQDRYIILPEGFPFWEKPAKKEDVLLTSKVEISSPYLT